MTASQTSIAKNFYVVSYWETDGGKGVWFVPCPISERRNALGRDCHQAYEVDTKETLHKVCYPLHKEFHLLI